MATSTDMPKLPRSDNPLKDTTNLGDKLNTEKPASIDMSFSLNSAYPIFPSPPTLADHRSPSKDVFDDANSLSPPFDRDTTPRNNFAAHHANTHHTASACAPEAA